MFSYDIVFLQSSAVGDSELYPSRAMAVVNRHNPIAKDDLLEIHCINLKSPDDWIEQYSMWRVLVAIHRPDPVDPVNQGRTTLIVVAVSKSPEKFPFPLSFDLGIALV